MPITTTSGGALVNGAPPSGERMKTTRIKALRGFYVAGKEIKADKEVVVPDPLARELISANKAVAVAEAPKAKQEPKAAPQAPAELKE